MTAPARQYTLLMAVLLGGALLTQHLASARPTNAKFKDVEETVDEALASRPPPPPPQRLMRAPNRRTVENPDEQRAKLMSSLLNSLRWSGQMRFGR
ncbi:hypothetical protein BOX15_Mlig011138g4 [Macrostomum lignano]|uniref:Pro-FMRFamide-related neuropeptide FF n=2 Tax=Macrostomum lignano TaxID=282301 RepID=A0A1I8HI79_9PLAT|nr:hypothetical protein BOX15_Mlig011138g4 [Macrostomum lignano]